MRALPGLLVCGALLAGCGGGDAEPGAAEPAAGAGDAGVRISGDTVFVSPASAALIGLEVAVPPHERLGDWIETTGQIATDPAARAVVAAPAQGRVESVAVSPGDRVARGQPLVRLSSPEYLSGAVALAAPRAGVVTARAAEVGEVVQPGDALVEIAGLGRVVLLVDLFPEMLPRVAPGAPVEFVLPGRDEAGEAQIASIDPQVDPATQAAQARVPLANPEGALRPGTFVRVRVLADPGGEAVLVPAEAVVRDSVGQWAFAPAGEGYAPRRVVARAVPGDRMAIVEGVEPGEPLVVRGAYQLHQAGFTFRGLATFGEEAEEEEEE